MVEDVCYIAKHVHGIVSCTKCYGKLYCGRVATVTVLDEIVTVNK